MLCNENPQGKLWNWHRIIILYELSLQLDLQFKKKSLIFVPSAHFPVIWVCVRNTFIWILKIPPYGLSWQKSTCNLKCHQHLCCFFCNWKLQNCNSKFSCSETSVWQGTCTLNHGPSPLSLLEIPCKLLTWDQTLFPTQIWLNVSCLTAVHMALKCMQPFSFFQTLRSDSAQTCK